MAYSTEQWDRAKSYYEAGSHSLSQIQDIIGISKSKLSEKAKKEQWEKGRNSDYIEAKVTIAKKKGTEKGTTIQILDDIVDSKLRRENLVFGATEKALVLLVDAMENKKPVEKIGVGDGVQQLQEVEYGSGDYKNFIEAIDKASITLGVNARHANTTINNTNAQQNNENTQIVFKRIGSNE